MIIGLLWEKVYTEREYKVKYDSSHLWKMTIGLLWEKFTQKENKKTLKIVHIHGK